MPRHPLPDADDVDPTGVRDLLAALPDPGPMPEDLVRRIEARLEVERAHLETERAGSGVTPADNVLDLAAERSRRRPIRTVALIGVAAGGLMVTTVALTQVLGPGGVMPDTAAVYPSRAAGPATAEGGGDARSAADDAAQDGAAQDEGAAAVQEDASDAGEAPAAAPESDVAAQTAAGAADEEEAGSFALAPTKDLQVTVLPAVVPVTAQDVATTLWDALQDDDVRFSSSDLSVPEAESCWRLLASEHDYAGHVATRTQFVDADGRGTPAIALLGLHHDDTGEAWVMPESCTNDAAQTPLSGPHPLD